MSIFSSEILVGQFLNCECRVGNQSGASVPLESLRNPLTLHGVLTVQKMFIQLSFIQIHDEMNDPCPTSVSLMKRVYCVYSILSHRDYSV